MKATRDVIGIGLSALFDAVWQYEEFHRVEYRGLGYQAQAFGFTPDAGCRVDGERIAGFLRLVQFPRSVEAGQQAAANQVGHSLIRTNAVA